MLGSRLAAMLSGRLMSPPTDLRPRSLLFAWPQLARRSTSVCVGCFTGRLRLDSRPGRSLLHVLFASLPALKPSSSSSLRSERRLSRSTRCASASSTSATVTSSAASSAATDGPASVATGAAAAATGWFSGAL